jgi:hypothetical protein
VARRQLQGHLPQGVVVEPQLLQVLQCPYLGTQFHQVVETQVESHQVHQGEHLWQHGIYVQLIQVQVVCLLRDSQPRLDLVVLSVVFISGKELIRLKVSFNLHISFYCYK